MSDPNSDGIRFLGIVRGKAGMAEELDIRRVRKGAPINASVSAWLLTCPGFSPYWTQFLLSVAHLRPVMGKRAKLHREGATHEFVLGALDPEVGSVDRETYFMLRPRLLRPLNVLHQVVGLSDRGACLLAKIVMQAVSDGRLVPEPEGILGARAVWSELLDENAEKLKEFFTLGN